MGHDADARARRRSAEESEHRGRRCAHLLRANMIASDAAQDRNLCTASLISQKVSSTGIAKVSVSSNHQDHISDGTGE